MGNFRDNRNSSRGGGFGGGRGNFRGGGRFGGGGRSFGGRDRDSGRSEMHDAVCAQCGKNCQIPFRPRGDKPVLCSECFSKKGDSPRSSSSSGASPGISNEQFKRLETKLDKIISILEDLEIISDDDEEMDETLDADADEEDVQEDTDEVIADIDADENADEDEEESEDEEFAVKS